MNPSALFRVLGFKHTLPALHAMLLGPRRFVELQRELKLTGLPMTRTIRQLEQVKLVARLESGPDRAIYGLTPRGRKLLFALPHLAAVWLCDACGGTGDTQPHAVVGESDSKCGACAGTGEQQ